MGLQPTLPFEDNRVRAHTLRHSGEDTSRASEATGKQGMSTPPASINERLKGARQSWCVHHPSSVWCILQIRKIDLFHCVLSGRQSHLYCNSQARGNCFDTEVDMELWVDGQTTDHLRYVAMKATSYYDNSTDEIRVDLMYFPHVPFQLGLRLHFISTTVIYFIFIPWFPFVEGDAWVVAYFIICLLPVCLNLDNEWTRSSCLHNRFNSRTQICFDVNLYPVPRLFTLQRYRSNWGGPFFAPLQPYRYCNQLPLRCRSS